MILPSDILTRNKIRDASIVNSWLSGTTQEELANTLKLTRHAIYSILRKNRSIMKIDKEHERINRIHILKHELQNSGPTEKDKLDIIEALRKEIEGDSKTNIDTKILVSVSMPKEDDDSSDIGSKSGAESSLLESASRPAIQIPSE